MADISFFNKSNSERIVTDVKWGEEQRDAGVSLISNDDTMTSQTIYAKVTFLDAGGAGFHQLEEVTKEGNLWTIVENGYKWDSAIYDFARHISWGSVEVGQIVKMQLIVNVEPDDGGEEWVFSTETTNPEVFILYAEENGDTGQASKDSPWTMKKAGVVATNVGEFPLPETTLLGPTYLGVQIEFQDVGYGIQLVGASYTLFRGPYWTTDEDEKTISVNWPICDVDVFGDISRLTQHHAGDIHLEVYEQDPNSDDFYIVGDNIWIKVTKIGNGYTVSHIGPDDVVWFPFKAIDDAFPCDLVNLTSFTEVTDFVNSLIEALIQIKVDRRGHIINSYPCDGSGSGNNTPEDPEDPDNPYTYLSLDSFIFTEIIGASTLVPTDVEPFVGIYGRYTVLNNGVNYLGLIENGESVRVSILNGLGEIVRFNAPPNPEVDTSTLLAQNIQNTSGREDGNAGADAGLNLGTFRFRFNDSIKVTYSFVNPGGLAKTDLLPTESCSASINLPSTTVRDRDDPLVEAFQFEVEYDILNLGPDPYKCTANFVYQDGSDVSYSRAQGGQYITGKFLLSLSANSETDPNETNNFYFDLDPTKVETAGTIRLCTELVTTDELYNANCDFCQDLNVQTEDECVVDSDGVRVTDESGDCITQAVSSIVEEIPLAQCSFPGSGSQAGSDQQHRGQGFPGNSFAAARTQIQDSSNNISGILGGALTNFITGGGQNSAIERQITSYNGSTVPGSTLALRFSWNKTGGDKTWFIFWKVAVLPAVNNPTFDMVDAWNLLGKVTISSASTFGDVDLDVSGLPKSANLQIGVTTEPDGLNDFSSVIDVSIGNNSFRATGNTLYGCP